MKRWASVTFCLFLTACGSSVPEPEPGPEAGSPTLSWTTRAWSGGRDRLGEDPHAVHGVLLSDGSFVMVGKSIDGRGAMQAFALRWSAGADTWIDDDPDAVRFAVTRGSADGEAAWLQVAGDERGLWAVGFEDVGAEAVGTLSRLDPETGTEDWAVRISEGSASSALESIVRVDASTIAVGGVIDAPRAGLEGFKSFGNVTSGTAHLAFFSNDGTALRSESYPGIVSLKSLAALPRGGVVAVGASEDETSVLLRVDADGREVWRRTFEELGELTDVALQTLGDGTSRLVVTGHGGEGTIDGVVAAVELDGRSSWRADFGDFGPDEGAFAAAGPDNARFIFDECWGVQTDGSGRVYAACGTGIEGCGVDIFPDATDDERAACEQDPRRTWRAVVAVFASDGTPLWQLAAALSDSEGAPFASAGEFLVLDDADVHVVVDHDFGVGWWHLSRP